MFEKMEQVAPRESLEKGFTKRSNVCVDMVPYATRALLDVPSRFKDSPVRNHEIQW